MRKLPTLLGFNLCLSSLAIAAFLVAGTSIGSPGSSQRAIAQVSPPAAKGANVGGPLARQLQGKPVVVEVHASWCPACKNIAPTLSQLKKQYEGKAHFIVLDVSDRAKASQSGARASQLGLGEFFATHKSQTGMVAIIDPATGNILAQHRNNANLAAYTSVLNSALANR